MEHSEFIRLEQVIDKLFAQYTDLKIKCKSLEVTLKEREHECETLGETISAMKKERAELGERVAGLIEKIEQWEATETHDNKGDEPRTSIQGSLFLSDS